MTTRPALPGSPEQPFHHRMNIHHTRAGTWGDVLLLGVHLAFACRSEPSLDATLALWQLTTCAAFAANIALRLLWPAQHMRWREALLLVLRLTGLGLGLGIRHVWQLVNAGEGLPDQLAAGPGQEAAQELALAGVAAQAMRLLFASCAGSLVMLAITMRMRLSLSALAQAGLVATMLPHTRAGCSGPLMAHPAVQPSTHRIYQALAWVGTPLPLPLAPMASPTPVDECATVVTFCQVGFGLLLPLLCEAVVAAGLFAAHQRQRRAAGLLPERGLQAWVYTNVWELCCGDEAGLTIPPVALAWVLLAVAWDWTAFLTASSQPA